MIATPTTPPALVAVGQEGLYVYCVARESGNRLLGPIGIEGRPVFTVSNGDICAVVHACQAQAYQSKDPRIVESWVAAHQGVVQAAAEAFGTVLPMAFDMIVRGASANEAIDALKQWLNEKRDRFAVLLDKLAGKAEYGVQVFWDREVVAAALVQHDEKLHKMQREALSKPKGLSHLLQQELIKTVRESMEKQADLFAQDFYARIRGCVDDVHVDKLRKTDGEKQMLLNLSCLMQQGRADLGRVLDDIQRAKGISVRFTGPWPPYSFVGG